MERRALLKMIAAITGGVFIGGELLTGCKSSDQAGSALFSNTDISMLDEIGDTILPATKTPGAKSVNIGKFMAKMVQDTYVETDRQIFIKGLAQLNEACKKSTSKSFMDASPGERTNLLTNIDKEAKTGAQTQKPDQATHYFTMMKQLTLLGYFSSKAGATEALRYLQVPGKYDGNFSYKKGDKAWAT